MTELPPLPVGYDSRMPRCEEAQDLCSAGLDGAGRDVWLTPAASDAWYTMRDAAHAAGRRLVLVSGFRSIARQAEIVARKLEGGWALDAILQVNAYPGHSEHHTGRAVDLGAPDCEDLTAAFAETPEFAWLLENAGRFGFRLSYPHGNPHGIVFEPWHWCWHPAASARE